MDNDRRSFREMLQLHFAEFLDLVEPGMRQRGVLDEVRLLDDAAADWPAADRRRLGVVAEVRTLAGAVTVLVQVEPRPGDRAVREARLLRYYLWLLVGRRRPVRLIVVYLRGGEPGIGAAAIVERRGDVEVMSIPYTTFGLEACRAADFLARPEARALAAFLQPGAER
jgi:hypothetical protein